MRVLGLDPGTARLGWGIVEHSIESQGLEKNIRCLGFGVIETPKEDKESKRLFVLAQELRKLLKETKPDLIAVETLYFFQNRKTAIKVAQARGVILLVAQEQDLEVLELTPLQIKSALVGYGRARKEQVQKVVQLLLGLKEKPQPDDSADALAIALCALRAKREQ